MALGQSLGSGLHGLMSCMSTVIGVAWALLALDYVLTDQKILLL